MDLPNYSNDSYIPVFTGSVLSQSVPRNFERRNRYPNRAENRVLLNVNPEIVPWKRREAYSCGVVG